MSPTFYSSNITVLQFICFNWNVKIGFAGISMTKKCRHEDFDFNHNSSIVAVLSKGSDYLLTVIRLCTKSMCHLNLFALSY